MCAGVLYSPVEGYEVSIIFNALYFNVAQRDAATYTLFFTSVDNSLLFDTLTWTKHKCISFSKLYYSVFTV